MQVFISWSGHRSLAVAVALKVFLENTFAGHVDTFVSDKDIAPGERFEAVVAANLSSASLGLLVLTPESLKSPWLLFEAGALAAKTPTGSVIPILVGLQRSDLQPPLSQFQNVFGADQEGINAVCERLRGEVAVPDAVFSTMLSSQWPVLEAVVSDALSTSDAEAPERRSVESMVKEILLSVNSLVRHPSAAPESRPTPQRFRDPAAGRVVTVIRALGAQSGTWGRRYHSPIKKTVTFVDVDLSAAATDVQLSAALTAAIDMGGSVLVSTPFGDFLLDHVAGVVQPLFSNESFPEERRGLITDEARVTGGAVS